MFNSKDYREQQMEFICIEQLVPSDHLLRKIDRYIDFSFIREKTRPLYCADNGRPSLDPIVLFKMLFIGYLYGIRSERQLVRDIEVNVAYRWFLGMTLTEKVPHYSTISQNRRRRFNQSNIGQEIFDEIVFQAMKKSLVDGKFLFTDSTHLKANANKKKFKREQVTKSTLAYIEALEAAIDDDRKAHGRKPLKPKDPDGSNKENTRETRVSTTDPESGFMVREGKPEGFFYLDHVTVDGKLNLITDVHVTPGNIHDSVPYVERLERQIERFGFAVEGIALDAGYLSIPICKALEDKGIFAVIAHRRFHPTRGLFPKWQFHYDAGQDCYYCPQKERLVYRTTNRHGHREYRSNPKICVNCPRITECTRSRNHTKLITRHVWEDSKEWVKENRLSPAGKDLYARRKETIERSFADAKELHGLRYARYRGRKKVLEQCLLTAAVMNMKKIANYLWRKAGTPLLARINLLFNSQLPCIPA